MEPLSPSLAARTREFSVFIAKKTRFGRIFIMMTLLKVSSVEWAIEVISDASEQMHKCMVAV